MSLYLEMEPLRRWLRLIEVIRVDPRSNRSGVLINEKGAADLSLSLSLSLSLCHVRTQQEGNCLQARKRTLTRCQTWLEP